MYKMRIIYTLLFLLCSLGLTAQEGLTVRGLVKDARTKAFLPNVTVSSPGLSASVMSNEKGEFTIEVNHRNTTLRIYLNGYILVFLFYFSSYYDSYSTQRPTRP